MTQQEQDGPEQALTLGTTDRELRIVRTSVLGIVANVLLAAFKAVVGVLSNSVAITLDAVNNLSDALSSVITIVGTRLADTLAVTQIDELSRCIQQEVYVRTGGKVIIEAVGVYARNSDVVVAALREGVEKIVRSHEHVLQMHGFHVDEDRRLMTFDVVVSFDAPDRRAEFEQIVAEVRAAYPDYQVVAALDTDVSD